MTNAKTSSLTGLKQRRIIGKVAFYVLGLLVAVIVCIPFYWMIITSLKGRGAIMSIPVEWIPKEPTLDAYKKLFAMPEFVGSIFNSFYVSVLCTAVRLLCAAMAAFALTKIPFKGRNAVFGIYVTALMIPSQITFIPLFIIMTNMHLTNGGDAIYQDMPQTGSGWHHVQVSNMLVTNGTINVGFYVKSSGGTTVHIDAVRLLKVSDAAIQSSESDVDAEEHDIPVTIASTEEQETASEETSPGESALYEDSENVEEIATPESAQPASDSTIPLEESEYAQEVA